MDKYTDSTTTDDTISPGLYSQKDIFNIEMVEKVKHAIDLSQLCNKVCFKDYTHTMTTS